MGRSPFRSLLDTTTAVVFLLSMANADPNNLNSYGVLSLKYRYAGHEISLSAFKRQLHTLAGVDLPLGGTGRPDASGSSSIEVQDEQNGIVHLVGAHYITSLACSLTDVRAIVTFSLLTMLVVAVLLLQISLF